MGGVMGYAHEVFVSPVGNWLVAGNSIICQNASFKPVDPGGTGRACVRDRQPDRRPRRERGLSNKSQLYRMASKLPVEICSSTTVGVCKRYVPAAQDVPVPGRFGTTGPGP